MRDAVIASLERAIRRVETSPAAMATLRRAIPQRSLSDWGVERRNGYRLHDENELGRELMFSWLDGGVFCIRHVRCVMQVW
jgi:hypothetical protein